METNAKNVKIATLFRQMDYNAYPSLEEFLSVPDIYRKPCVYSVAKVIS